VAQALRLNGLYPSKSKFEVHDSRMLFLDSY